MPRRRKDWGFCPRCGKKISWMESYTKGDRVYYVAVHYYGKDPETGKKDVKKCHLGPEEYDYVTKTHPLVLQGAIEDIKEPNARMLAYLDALIEALPYAKLDSEKALMLAARFKGIGAKLEQYAEEAKRATAENGDSTGLDRAA